MRLLTLIGLGLVLWSVAALVLVTFLGQGPHKWFDE
jgi:hypothetical protein